jgi:hypothetical protein
VHKKGSENWACTLRAVPFLALVFGLSLSTQPSIAESKVEEDARHLRVCNGDADPATGDDAFDHYVGFRVFACYTTRLEFKGGGIDHFIQALRAMSKSAGSGHYIANIHLKDCVVESPSISQCWFYLGFLTYLKENPDSNDLSLVIHYLSRAISTSMDAPKDYYYFFRASTYLRKYILDVKFSTHTPEFLHLARLDLDRYMILSSNSNSASDAKFRKEAIFYLEEIEKIGRKYGSGSERRTRE